MDKPNQKSQKNKISLRDIKNSVFHGSSVKGIAYIVAYKWQLEAGLNYEQLKTSAGLQLVQSTQRCQVNVFASILSRFFSD